MRTLPWIGLLVGAIGVAGYAAVLLFSASLRNPFVAGLFTELPLWVSLHLAGGLIAILTGAFQVNAGLRARSIELHRWLGRAYVLAVLTSGTAGFMLALDSTGGFVTHVGFGMMAVCWLLTTSLAYWHVRHGRIAAHRAWMLRSYALTLAALTLRIYLPLTQVAGMEFVDAYRAIAWLCWVPNLLVVEWFILHRATERSPG